ncbi:mitochondrial inner membrane protease subunit 1 isoform X2 [Bufo bufo]|uniref:mitochondrial inner membrane protease subunit 1 isoform X2 n=1 Tax=Bufo bufo TaxID=8384 RepID=UPI001ABDBF81|nr:mitochondrial inner membrane protease subunit 1 isoform X2 [Bufo bufo]
MIRKVIGKSLGFLGYAIQYGCIAHCTFEYLGEIVICSGPSMEPTIKNYDILVCDNLSRHLYSIHKGDVIIAKSPNKPNINICKRVIGLEGDKVCTSSPADFIKRHTYITQNILYGSQNILHGHHEFGNENDILTRCL